jgi:pimeloyl-ACP methyl ester carboxylesterase
VHRKFVCRSHRAPRRFVAFVALLAAAHSAGQVSASSAPPTADAAGGPTIVLVHGAFADASSWNGVIAELLADGHDVIAPPNPLRGVASDAQYLSEFLATIEGPIVLVGHSYGGFVITNAATGDPDVEALVYIAAFAPDAGETVGGISASVPGSLLGAEALVIRPYTKADGTEGADGYIAPDAYHDVFAADVDPALAAVLAVTQRPADLAILGEPSGDPAWATIPSFDLVATQDNVIPADAQRSMAERAGATTVEVDASHSVAVSQPGTVADFIVDAVTSVS